MERGDLSAVPEWPGNSTREISGPISGAESSPDPAPEEPTRQSTGSVSARRLFHNLVVGAVFLIVLHSFVVQISVVRGHSMEPSLWDGDRLLVDRLSYSIMDVGRFDMVVLRYPVDPSVDFVKRIVGLPGDRIRIHRGLIMVNGGPLPSSFKYVRDRAKMSEITVPEDQYFVLGDNRPISCDSREFGLVPASFLKGKVRARFWPLRRARVFP